MIEPGDKVLVAISGGKDSIVMMKILVALKGLHPLNSSLYRCT
jgi:tRNA(Ile)-lysidine synthase TilS/MesJ